MTTTSTHERARRPESGTGAVRLRGVTKTFGGMSAVHGLDLDVAPGEFLSMLGPSGSGKTTVLRMIAGFEEVTSGTIELGGVDVTRTAPYDRPVNTVFQDYALFPHLTVADNVGYGLKVRRAPKAERVEQVRAALDKVRLGHVAERLPSQLSGGQRQRIALARALILEPEVLLLDEPLGALDKQLREEMQIELKQIQRNVGITFVFVTHDQEEALTLSDRVAVFDEGRIEQIGTAREVYEYPQTDFVARFLGLSNLIPADAVGAGPAGATVSIRPERVRLLPAGAGVPEGDAAIAGEVAELVYTGPSTRYVITADDGRRVIASVQNSHHPDRETEFSRGDRVLAAWTADHASPVPANG